MTEVLVVSKISELSARAEFFQQRLASGALSTERFARLQKAQEEHQATLDALLQLMEKWGMAYELIHTGDPFPRNRPRNLVFAVGGDGTVLAAARQIADRETGLIGIRSSSLSVGYLCSYGLETFPKLIGRWREQRLGFRSVSRLTAMVHRPGSPNFHLETEPVLNDFLFAHTSPGKTSRYQVSLDQRSESQLSSGMWIATAVGSTAAIRAAGGKRVPYEREDFQFLTRESMKRPGQSLELEHGFFNPDSQQFSIENGCYQAILASDGGFASITVEYGDVITFKRAAPLRLHMKS